MGRRGAAINLILATVSHFDNFSQARTVLNGILVFVQYVEKILEIILAWY